MTFRSMSGIFWGEGGGAIAVPLCDPDTKGIKSVD